MMHWIPPTREVNTGVDASNPETWHNQVWTELGTHILGMTEKYGERFPEECFKTILIQMFGRWVYVAHPDNWDDIIIKVTDKVINQIRQVEYAKLAKKSV